MAAFPLVLLVTCSLYTVSLGLYSTKDSVVVLNDKNFNDLVGNSDGVAVVEFFAPWCGHCQSLAPQYKKVAENLKGIALVGAVDCDSSDSKGLCSKAGVKGFPTLKLYSGDKQKNPYTGELSKEAQEYTGPRTAKAIASAVTELLTDFYIVKIRSSTEFKTFIDKNQNPKVLLFTNKEDSTTLYKSLSMQLRGGLSFAEIHESVQDVVKQYDITHFPTLVVLKQDGVKEVYEGELKAAQLLTYLKSHLAKVGGGPSSEATGFEQNGNTIPGEELSIDKLDALNEKEDMALLVFYAEGDEGCDAQLKQLGTALSDVSAMLRVVRCPLKLTGIDEVATSLQMYGVKLDGLRAEKCTPQLVLLPFGEDKVELDDYMLYEGALEAKSLQKWTYDAMPAIAMEVLDHNLQSFIAYRPNGEATSVMAPKVLLFTNKDDIPGLYKALAINFRSAGLSFGWVPTNSHHSKRVQKEIKPPKVPFLAVLLAVPQKADEQGGVPLSIQPYQGQYTYKAMAAWLEQLLKLVKAMSGEKDEGSDATVEVAEVADDKSFEETCKVESGICIISLVEPTQQESHVSTLSKVAGGRVGQPLAFMFVVATAQPQLLSAYNVLRSDLPTVVALSRRKMRYATMTASYTAEDINNFIDSVLSGRTKTLPLHSLPPILPGGEGANAEPASAPIEEEEIVEEEFNLADIMSEEVEVSLGTKADKLKEVEEQLAADEANKKKEAKKAKKKKSKKKKKASDEL